MKTINVNETVKVQAKDELGNDVSKDVKVNFDMPELETFTDLQDYCLEYEGKILTVINAYLKRQALNYAGRSLVMEEDVDGVTLDDCLTSHGTGRFSYKKAREAQEAKLLELDPTASDFAESFAEIRAKIADLKAKEEEHAEKIRKGRKANKG